jgi:hypothetical protein
MMQRQPDGAFVLAQRGGDLSDRCLAVARAPDPRGRSIQVNGRRLWHQDAVVSLEKTPSQD